MFLFTYRIPEMGTSSIKALASIDPLLKDIRPFTHGKVFAPLPHCSQSADRLDEIIEEVAAILHPELYKNYTNEFFVQLTDKN